MLLSAHFTNDVPSRTMQNLKFGSHTGRSNPLKDNGLIRVKYSMGLVRFQYGFSTGLENPIWVSTGKILVQRV